MKLLITESQRQRLLKEEPLLSDILKKAIMKAIDSPEVQNLIKKGMENVIEKGAGEVRKFSENPKGYIQTLKTNIKSSINLKPNQNVNVPGEFEDVEVEDVEVENVQIKERPAIVSKKAEIERNKRYLKELTNKKGYKSRRDRDNADLLKINVAKLERDLQSLYDEE
jgi:hypothetical protein|tara:strand:+ start:1208 stop:1708 length:501 start_codon:yes stop_codon:yes gene_type:complete